MTISQLNQAIGELDEKIKKESAELEPLAQSFISIAVPSVIENCKNRIESIVKSQPERLVELGSPGVRKLKGDLGTFYTGLESSLKVALNETAYWPHRESYDLKRKGELWQTSGGALVNSGGTSGAVSKLLSPIGTIFSKHGIFNGDGGNWYNYFTFSKEVNDCGIQYAIAWKLVFEKQIELTNLKRKKLEAEASNLWEES